MKLLTKILLAAVLCILPISAYSVPSNSGAGSGKSSGNRNLITNTVTLSADPQTCQAPCSVEFTVTVHGTDIGRALWYLICGNDEYSKVTEIVYLDHTGLLSAEYTFDEVCQYDAADTYTPYIIGAYQAGAASASTSVVVTEATGSIAVSLAYDQDNDVEPTDIDLTATVIGETGNVTCDFWCSCEDALGDPTTPPCNNPADDAALVGATPLTSTECSDANNKPTAVGYEEGTYIPAVSCTRNGVGPVTAYNQVIVDPQAISVSLQADPNSQASSPLDDVDLIATVSDNCSEDTLELDFECVNGGGIDYAINATDVRDYSIVDQGDGDCDGYTDAPGGGSTDYVACVTAACTNGFAAGLSTAAESCTTISVNAAATPATFIANPAMDPTNVVDEGYTGLDVILQISGTATGPITNIDVNCGAGGGWEGFGSNSIADPSACEGATEDCSADYCCSLMTETAFAGCDYATDVGSPFTVSTTADRDSVTSTSSAVVTVNNVPDPAELLTSPAVYPYITSIQVTQGSNPATKTITITNTGGSNLIWSDFDSETGAGISCDTTDGATGAPDGTTIAAGASDELYCSFTTSSLAVGTYYAYVAIGDNASPNGVSPTSALIYYSVEVIAPSDNVTAHINASRGVTTAPYEPYSPDGGRDACTAPCTVYFDGINSTIAGLDEDEVFLLGDFVWDFDDDPTDYWESGALATTTSYHQSKNIEYGPTAGHLFEDPGTYHVKMTLCTSDGSSCDYDTKTITVADPDSVYNGGDTHCFSNDADFTGCPSGIGAQTHTTADLDDALQNLCGVEAANAQVRCLFKRGDTFALVNSQIQMYSGSGVQIGAFGDTSDPKPILQFDGLIDNAFYDHAGFQNWTLYDVYLYNTSNSTYFLKLDAHKAAYHQFACIRCEAEGWGRVFYFLRDDAHQYDPGGIYLYEWKRETATPGMSYSVYGGARAYWLAGAVVGDPTNNDDPGDIEQHWFRLTDLTGAGASIAHNYIAQGCGNFQSHMKIHNSHRADANPGYPPTESISIMDNYACLGGTFGEKYTTGVGSTSGGGAVCRRFLFERNYSTLGPYTGIHGENWAMFHGASINTFMFRNNIMNCSTTSDDTGGLCRMFIADNKGTGALHPLSSDLYFYNNDVTHYGANTAGTGLISLGDADTSTIESINNLMYVTGSSFTNMYSNGTPSVNVDNESVASDPWVNGSITMEAQDFRLNSQQLCDSLPTGVRRDFSGAIRTGCTKGAWDY